MSDTQETSRDDRGIPNYLPTYEDDTFYAMSPTLQEMCRWTWFPAFLAGEYCGTRGYLVG
jgi:hypothetical protein